jgi:signal transduction histidine kinase
MEESRLEPEQRKTESEQDSTVIPKPFPLVRYYVIASILLVVGAFAIINFSTQRIQDDTTISHLKSLTEQDVEPVVFDISLAVTSHYGPGDDLVSALSRDKTALDRDVVNAISGENISRVDLLTPTGVLAYSTDPKAVPTLSSGESSEVLSGGIVSRYESDYELTLFNGESVNISTVMTAIPISTEWSVEGSGPVAVLVTYTDVTESAIGSTGIIAPERVLIVAGTMAALFALLSWIVARGHRFTTRAREQLSDLLESEREIRSQLDVRNVELEEANRAKSQFLSMVSHELKTPLTAIISFTRTLDKSLKSSLNDRQERQFEAVVRNSKYLNLLIDELLDVSAASTGKLRLHFTEVKPSDIAIEAGELVQPMIDTRKQQLSVSVSDPDQTINGDAGRLLQVISNLLSNASKYTPENSEITLDVLRVDDTVCFRVTDHGMGISEEDQQSLFSTFFRTQDAVESGVQGTGLGLVIVRSIVEGHGGVVKIDSEVGNGTTVMVEIPLSGANQMPDDGEQEAAA